MLKVCRNFFVTQIARKLSTTEVQRPGVLHWRFFDHLKQQPRSQITNSKLAAMIKLSKDHQIGKTKEYFERLKQIDDESFMVMQEKSPRDIYSILDLFVDAFQGRFTKFKSYSSALESLIQELDRRPDQKDFVKLCFYIGQYKKIPPGPEFLSALLKTHLDDMMRESFDSIDFAIICAAAYKTSVKTSNESFKQRLISEITKDGDADEFLFVTFMKSLRMNRINSPKVIKKLQEMAKTGEIRNFSSESLVHIFTFVAENNLKDEKMSSVFVERFLELVSDQTRTKDIQKLLYSCALLNQPIAQEHLQKLERQVLARTKHVEYKKKFDCFVDVTLSMWLLNFRSKELFDILSNDSRFNVKSDMSRIKLDSRKKLLSTCVEIEEPQWLPKRLVQSSFDETRQAPRYLIKPSLQSQVSKMDSRRTKFVQQIKNLNIGGILDQQNNTNVHYEVVDDTNCLSDKITPNGLFSLKIRLMKKLGCEVTVVSNIMMFNVERYYGKYFLCIDQLGITMTLPNPSGILQ
jgi:hypothetical protein